MLPTKEAEKGAADTPMNNQLALRDVAGFTSAMVNLHGEAGGAEFDLSQAEHGLNLFSQWRVI